MFELEVYPEWFDKKKPEVTVFVRGDDKKDVKRTLESLENQNTERKYEVVVVTTSKDVVKMLEELKLPLVRWCVGKEKGYHTARGDVVEIPAGYEVAPDAVETLVSSLSKNCTVYGRIEFPSGRRKSRKVFAVRGSGRRQKFVNRVVASR